MNKSEQLHERLIRNWKAMDERSSLAGMESWEELTACRLQNIRENEEEERVTANRIETVSEYLRSRGLLRGDQTVIDVGCGTGRFTAEFAKTAKHVTGMDISPTACDAARRRAGDHGLRNVDVINADFAVFDPEKEGALKKYDLVFSSMMPVAESYEGFRKLESMSRGSCFAAFPTELTRPLLQELAFKAAGGSLGNPPGRIMRFMRSFNVLCLEGKRPETFFFETCSSTRIPANETGLMAITRLWPMRKFTEDEKKKLLSLLEERAARDGTVTSDTKAVVGCLLWKPDVGRRS